jgi:hypothetical protein
MSTQSRVAVFRAAPPEDVIKDGETWFTHQVNEQNKTQYSSQWKQDQVLEPWLVRLAPSKGTFIESGARDGIKESNTLYFEKQYGWSGLLVEPSNAEFPNLQKNSRNAYEFHGAISTTGKSGHITFQDTADGLSKQEGVLLEPSALSTSAGNDTVAAAPLSDLLSRMYPLQNDFHVDFWSLDVEGAEGGILETTDFQRIKVGVFMIEMNKGEKNNERILTALAKQGFVNVGRTKYDQGYLDGVFVNPKYWEERGLSTPTTEDATKLGLGPPFGTK